jgi:hypothetical protein
MLSGSSCFATETKELKEEFSQIAEDEIKRIQEVAEKENERILQAKRENETVQVCPVCLEEDRVIKPHGEHKVYGLLLCCNARHCSNCMEKSKEFMFGHGMKNAKCYNCREPYHNLAYWANTIKPNDHRDWILGTVGCNLLNGTNGLRKNTKKAIKLMKRAAELGDACAQDDLAHAYYFGDSGLPRCLEKARYYAEKGAEQGTFMSQSILANVIMTAPDFNRNEDNEQVIKLLTLSSYQGYYLARMCLGGIYDLKSKRMKRRSADGRKNLLLGVYWFGKAAELAEGKDPRMGGCKALALMALRLDLTMRLIWYPRPGDPPPGYSHIPFCTWALAKGDQHTEDVLPLDPSFDMHSRKNGCANCGIASLEDEQFKQCARCKAVYYCSKKCQVEHWKAGHKVDCKGYWIEEFFPEIRKEFERYPVASIE